MPVRVKVCGLTREEDVVEAVDAGADAVGFISGFPESPRDLSLARVSELMAEVPPFVERVLVTRYGLLETSLDEVARLGPSAIQAYGFVGDSSKVRDATGAKLILPRLVDGGPPERQGVEGFDAVLSYVDANGRFGGTGQTSDWKLCRELREMVSPTPFILSGGLNPGNVTEAIGAVRPYAVDVSSGVEAAPGIKDAKKVREFVRAAESS